MSLKINRIGFWVEEFWSNRSIEDDLINEYIENENKPNEVILEYLNMGIPIMSIRATRKSKITGAIIGPIIAYSDGVWAWTNILIHYYSNGALSLPEEFISHANNANKIFLKYGLMKEDQKKQIADIIRNPESPLVKLK